MSWIFNGAGSFEKLPVQEDGPRTCHSERSEESQNECAEAKHIKIQDFSYLTTFHCNSIFALLLSFPKSLNFLLSPQTLPVSPNSSAPLNFFRGAPQGGEGYKKRGCMFFFMARAPKAPPRAPSKINFQKKSIFFVMFFFFKRHINRSRFFYN